MDALTIDEQPPLKAPLLITAFTGWNDAGDAASDAVRYLRRRSRASKIAAIDPDEFFVFTEQRPTVRSLRGDQREIRWPTFEFAAGHLAENEHDLILAVGPEPHLRWRSFSELMLEFIRRFDVREVASLGALLANVAHTRPVPVTGSATDPQRARALGFTPSRYEGPTGIVGALGEAYRRAQIPTVGLWASVPHYLSSGGNPRATHALLHRLNEIYELHLNLDDLEARGRRFDAQVTQAIKENPEVQAYVHRLEAESAAGDTPPSLRGTPPPELRSIDVLDAVDRLLRGEGDGDADAGGSTDD